MRIDIPVRNSFCNNDLNRYLYSESCEEHNTGLDTGRDRHSCFAVPAGKLNEAQIDLWWRTPESHPHPT